jgi:glycosyltransferase involved in cell wall biosynthesis
MSDLERHFEMRVLVVAESANPEFVSVPLEGWSHSVAISRLCNAIVVTQIRNRKAFLDAGMQEGSDFEAIDSEWLAKPLYRVSQLLRKAGLGWTATTAMASLAYYAFERALCRQFRDRLMAGEFDLVHRITPLSPTVPSLFLSRLCERAGIPLVIGPINGGVSWPKGFRSALRAEGEWLSYIRSAYKLLPGYARTLRTASAIVVGSRDTFQQVPQRHHSKCVYVAENAIDPHRFSLRSKAFSGYPLKAAFVGRLVPYKGCDMMLEALAGLIRDGRVIVNVYGDGPERTKLEAFCKQRQIDSGVEFHGWVKHSELQVKLVENNLFVFPSIREFGGAVVLEAMALGVVPVIVRYGGPGELVNADAGLAIPMGPRSDIVQNICDVMTRIAENPGILDAMRDAGLERVGHHFTWDAKAQKIIEIYRWVLGKRDTKPDTDPGFSSLPADIEPTAPDAGA